MVIIKELSSEATISETGSYLQRLVLDGKDILLAGNESRPTLGGMALLIPFANRIKGGEYEFNGKKYFLTKNSEGNAIHGLILNKKFNIVNMTENSIELSHDLIDKGYPTELKVNVIYKIYKKKLFTKILLTNLGNEEAPVVVGAHPYFLIKNNWEISPNKVKKCISINKIPTGEFLDFEIIGNKDYDDCFYIGNNVSLKSDYSQISIETLGMPYFQIYTGIKGALALEPMSGLPDAFHNKIGLNIIKPSATLSFEFTINKID